MKNVKLGGCPRGHGEKDFLHLYHGGEWCMQCGSIYIEGQWKESELSKHVRTITRGAWRAIKEVAHFFIKEENGPKGA